MTLVSSIITSAYRETNLVSLAGGPTTAQVTEALGRLNSLILSTVGNEAGDDLTELNYGGSYDESTLTNSWVPDNARLILNLTADTTLYLDPYPQEGQRLAIVDVGSNLATNNLVLDGNGRLVEGAATLTLSTDDLSRQWMYRSDTGNWVRISELTTSDQMPFPIEFDDYFIIMLALRLNPRYGQMMTAESMKMLGRSRSLLHSRYNQTKEVYPDLPPLDNDKRGSRMSNDDFATGRVRWR